MEIKKLAVNLIAGALHIEASAVNEDTGLAVTPQWDSLAHMRLILSLEEQLGCQLKPEQIVELTKIDDVIMLLENKGNEK